jgi:hypothetical protein
MTHFLCLKRHTAIIILSIANKNSEPGINAVGVGGTAGDGVGDGSGVDDGVGVSIGVTVGVTVGMGVAVGVKCGTRTSFSFLGDGVGEGS